MDAPVIGVDVGGTKILAGVVDREGRVRERHLSESPVSAETDVLAALEDAIAAVLDDSIAAIGLGIPANLERGTGRVMSAVNLPLTDLDVAGHVRDRFGLPVGIENDGGAATLAEWRLGAGRGTSNLVLLTLGTGIGAGFILDDALYRGWAEVGHVVVVAGGPPCQGACHGHGHLEAVASGSAADRVAQDLWGPAADARELLDRARAGDEDAVRAVSDIARYLGAAIGSLANLFDPELVVIGGGFGEAAGVMLLETVQEAARAEALTPSDERLRVVGAELGADAGLVGAALVGYEAHDGIR